MVNKDLRLGLKLFKSTSSLLSFEAGPSPSSQELPFTYPVMTTCGKHILELDFNLNFNCSRKTLIRYSDHLTCYSLSSTPIKHQLFCRDLSGRLRGERFVPLGLMKLSKHVGSSLKQSVDLEFVLDACLHDRAFLRAVKVFPSVHIL